MSSSPDASLIALYANATVQLNRYFAILIFGFGAVGHIANVWVLSQKAFRSNPCAWLLLVSSIAYFIAIFSALLSRFLSTWALDLTETNAFLCKFRAYLIFTSLTCAFWIMVLATVDRWLSSSRDATRRRLSSLKNAQRGLIMIIVVALLVQAHHLYCVEANLIHSPIRCNTHTVLCRILSDLTIELGYLILPLLFMIPFSLMTISNIRHSQRRLHAVTISTTPGNQQGHGVSISTNGQESQQKKLDRQLLKMLVIQVWLTVLCTSPLSISRIYSTITADTSKSPLQYAIEGFVFNLFVSLSFIVFGVQFYINMLIGGVLFRNTFYGLMRQTARKLVPRHS